MGICYDAPKLSGRETDGRLPVELIPDWAENQMKKSVAYRKGEIPGSSATEGGRERKQAMIDAIERMFIHYGRVDDFAKFQPILQENLEDPGALDNFYYFDVPNSQDMTLFYYHIWCSHDMARAMEPLHGYGYDMRGTYRKCPEDESWARMISYEGIAINERKKSSTEAFFIETECFTATEKIIFLGGGIPHLHLYSKKTSSKDLVMLDSSFLPSDAEFKNYTPYYHSLKYYKLDLFNAPKLLPKLAGKFDCVVMDGVSSYLYPERCIGSDGVITYLPDTMIKALSSGFYFLRDGGVMILDLLMKTKGMARVGTAQHWPKAEMMRTFSSVSEADDEMEKLVSGFNNSIGEAGFKPDISGTLLAAEPWGTTGVVYTLHKNC